jgi:Mg/Co/Ni transporter MgtE
MRAAGMTGRDEKRDARTGRLVGLVIALTMSLWIAAQWIAPAVGLHPSFAFLFDLAALAALFWSLVVVYGLWQRQKRAGR